MREKEILDPKIDYEAGISNTGDLSRMQRLIRRAQRGEALKLAFLGGSITQGSLASSPENCYAARVAAWWKRTFPKADFTYINAGIGGTTSQFGCARVRQDVLEKEPDLVVVEFSVNDESTPFFLETYEGVVRKILAGKTEPAVLIVHNVCYDNGANAQVQHAKIARHYRIPAVSMQSSVYPQVVNGNISSEKITPDNLHPNDYGHGLVAGVIIYFLEKILADAGRADLKGSASGEMHAGRESWRLPDPLTANRYEAAVRYQNSVRPAAAEGFLEDQGPQKGITDTFKNGWTADQPGARILFEIEATEIAVQYRKSVQKPAPVARAVIDGQEAEAVLLDGNFDEDWGDCLYIETLLYHGEFKKHTVEITILQSEQKAAVPFYLTSIIGSS